MKPEYLKKYGYTVGCVKCRGMQNGDRRTISRSHTVQCRDRIKACLARDGVQESIDGAIQRQSEFLADEVERDEGKKKARIAIEFEETIEVKMDEDGMPASTDQVISRTPAPTSTTSSSSGLTNSERPKRGRRAEEDEEEKERPTHYQATEEEEEKKEDTPMLQQVMENFVQRRGGPKKTSEDDADGLLMMKDSKYGVVEIFSPPRICPRATARGLKGGWSLDWMFCDPISHQWAEVGSS